MMVGERPEVLVSDGGQPGTVKMNGEPPEVLVGDGDNQGQ